MTVTELTPDDQLIGREKINNAAGVLKSKNLKNEKHRIIVLAMRGKIVLRREPVES